MIIKTLGYEIEQVPGYAKIIVEPQPQSAGGVHVALDDGASQPRSFGVEEAAELADALTQAATLGRQMVRQLEEHEASLDA